MSGKVKVMPRDFYKKDTIGLVWLARLYSNVVSPPVMSAVLGLLVSFRVATGWTAVGWYLVYGSLTALSPIVFVLALLRLGYIEELHMTNTRERYLPYVVSVCCAAVAYLALSAWQGPELLGCLALLTVVQLTFLSVVNVFWLISLHAAGAMATSMVVAFVWGGFWGMVVGVPLVVSVCYVRLFLRRHTLGQVMAGLVVGGGSVFLLAGFGCF